TVDGTGTVTALKAGVVTISASTGATGLTAQTQLTVSSPVPSSQIAGISIMPSHVAMNVGDTFWLQAQVPTWSGGYDPNVQWEVGDSSIVNVSVTGQITALKPGSTTVTAIAVSYLGAQPLTATIPVIVNNAASSQ
ncbi:MAG TPA: Ig-like domain-containing protein, partial [Oscillatoriaceae cyanobacterium]